jgi:parvulin-like peptidyl-prolyl isomerase
MPSLPPSHKSRPEVEYLMVIFRGKVIQDDVILNYLKRNLQLKQICCSILTQEIINKFSQEQGITVTDEEIQAEVERLRYKHRLSQDNDIFAWLTDQLITIDAWQAGIRDRLLAENLSYGLFAREVEKVFSENQLDFDQVLLYRIVVPYEQVAQEILYQIQESELSFYEAAHIYDVDERRRHQCGYEGKVYRWNLHPDISSVVFSTVPGNVIGPLSVDQLSHLLRVEEFIPAELTSERYQEILNRMFDEWLTTELNYMLDS